MKIVGGSYLEICLVPHWRRILGSGGRAAIAASPFCKDLEFHTYAGGRFADDIKYTMHSFGIGARVTRIEEDISFSYFHPLSVPHLSPKQPKQHRALRVKGDNVLRFGFVEGDAIVDADYAVYDPQGDPPLARFEANGSIARHVAYVLNERELLAMMGKSSATAAVASLLRGRVEAVIVKRGTAGVSVYTRERSRTFPVYWSDQVFKIGSGDIFSAMFALKWAHERRGAFEAANFASRAVAEYVETRSLPIAPKSSFANREPLKFKKWGRIYLAGPFFDISKRWLIEESLRALENLGAEVFSPFHDVGLGGAEDVARRDLKGLNECAAVLALLDGTDPGTLFEIGYARRKNIPVIVFAENVSETDLTMMRGTRCDVVKDFATAIYRVVWASGRR